MSLWGSAVSSDGAEQPRGFALKEADRLTLSGYSAVRKAVMQQLQTRPAETDPVQLGWFSRYKGNYSYQELRRKHIHTKNEAACSSCTG